MQAIRPPADIFHAGEVLGDAYEIRTLIGSGGMGQVFDAYDRLLCRRVAVKAQFSHAACSLRAEARALAALHHPGLVAVYAMGAHHGTEYVVMERLYGRSLECHLEECGPLRYDEAVATLVAIAEALAAVHAAGVAHRDVKPANVLLAAGGRVVLVDFGIHVPECERTRGDPMGSPSYMAPETITGTLRHGGAYLVDVYAYGVVAYEVLVGRPPYEHKTVAGLLSEHVHAAVPRVSAARPDVPAALSELVARMMAKDPGERPPSMEHIVWELRRFERAAPASAARRR